MGDQDEKLREAVRSGYGSIARSGGSCCGPQSCCGGASAGQVAEALGYDRSELDSIPEGANMGLSCGNPTALASLAPGEVVLDLGSGGGFDVFLAARRVGPSGRAIGVDMTPEMLSKARGGTAAFTEATGLDNVEFRLGEIEHLPVADSSIDVVISNCVINLSPDKPGVWREIARVLRPGGRVAVSDLALLRPLPDSVRESIRAYVGCLAGAIIVEETEKAISDAGLVVRELRADPTYIRSMGSWSDPLYQELVRAIPEGTGPADFVTSLEITAVKPMPEETAAAR
jgi:SAM-dependent methyltransferase